MRERTKNIRGKEQGRPSSFRVFSLLGTDTTKETSHVYYDQKRHKMRREGEEEEEEEEEDEEEEEEEEEEFAVRLSYAFDISNALVRSRLGTMMITNDKSEENNNKDKDKEVLKTMVFTLKEERFSSSSNEQKGDVSTRITLSVDAHEMQKILERVPLRVKENTACVFVETMKREDDNSKKYIVDDRLTVVAKHFRCEETGKLKRQFVNPFV